MSFINRIRIIVAVTVACLAMMTWAPSAHADVGDQLFKLLADDGAEGDSFGISVAISGTTAIVGASGDDDNGDRSGSAYLFDTTTGQQIAKLLADDGAAVDSFGFSVAIIGATAIVGAKNDDDNGETSGSAYLFDATTGKQIAKLLADDGAEGDEFGSSVAVSGAPGKETAIVGAPDDEDNGNGSGSAYLFDISDPKNPIQRFKLLPDDGGPIEFFGISVAISGTTAIVGANGAEGFAGSAYLFDTTTGQQLFKLLPNDGASGDAFGRSVAISGTTAIGGAASDEDNGSASGSAYLFDTITGQQLFKLVPKDNAEFDRFGDSVAITGTIVVVGADGDDDLGSQSGAAYLFDITGKELFKLLPDDGAAFDQFGFSVAITGAPGKETAIVGAWQDDDDGTNSGSAYLFDAAGTAGGEAELLSFSVFRGELVAGDLQSLQESDDDSVEIDAELVDLLQPVYLSNTLIRATSPATTVSRLDLMLETGVDVAPVLTRILLRNFDTGKWDLLDGFRQSVPDSEAMILDVPNPNAYVHDAHGQIAVRIETRANAAQVPDGYVFRIDHVQLAVTTGEGGGIAGGDNALPCDLDGDEFVGASDLVILLGAWGTDPGGPPDFNGDGVVNPTDLIELLGAWGPCP